MLTQKQLKKILHYDPDSGIFTRKTHKRQDLVGKEVGSKVTSGYLGFNIDGKLYTLHRLAFLYMTGRFPEQIDHINGVPSDNRWDNLRAVTKEENRLNLGLFINNKSGITGVSWFKGKNYWRVYIKRIFLGSFKDFFEACCIRKSSELELGFHENHGQRLSTPRRNSGDNL